MDVLIRYGTPGMKWGVRRYQNYDGTLTPAGKLRYGHKAISLNTMNRKEIIKLYRSGKDFCLSKSDKLYRATNTGTTESGRLYVSAKKYDADWYLRNLDYVGGKLDNTADAFLKTYDLKKKLNVAGANTQIDMLADLYDAPGFKKAKEDPEGYLMSFEERHKLDENAKRIDIDIMNKNAPERNKLISMLTAKGYDAVTDIVDSLSVAATDTPLVLLDSTKSIGKEYVDKYWQKGVGWIK